jgi:hypothetical protein
MSRTINTAVTGPVVLTSQSNPLTITSTGKVSSTGAGVDGIDGGAGATWTITNAGQVVSSGGDGISLAGAGVIGNSGSVSGIDGIVIRSGGNVTNNTGVSISGTGSIGAGLGSGAGVYITGSAGTVTNRGVISGTAYGVGLAHGGVVTNSDSLLGGEDGIIVEGGAGVVTNYARITATVDDGISLFDGGRIRNAAGATIAGSGTAGARTGSGGNGPRDSAGSGAGGSGGGSGTSTAGAGPGAGTGTSSGTGNGPGAGPGAGAGTGGGSLSVAGSTPVRIVRPINGSYDVAVVQSGASIPGTSGFLRGRPVYSVYLSLGDGKEWILQYCLPPDENRRATQGQVVQLGTAAPLNAPFAYLILKPNIQLRDGVRYGFIHAFVNASGRFDQMTEVGDPVIEHVEAVIQSLQKWEFRPASKDGVPTLVEVLLCIPSA